MDIDALLLEGTHVLPAGQPSREPLTEAEVERLCVELSEATEGIVLANYSAQNIDRLVTLFRAAKRSGRHLVLDLYAATIARATGAATIPQAEWDGVLVYVPQSQRVRVKASGEFERVEAIRSQRIYPEDLVGRAGELVLTFRGSMAREIERAGCLVGARALWSLWSGYLSRPAGEEMRHWFDSHGITLTIAHASGHATIETLQRFVAALSPQQVVPIHTAAPERFPELFPNVNLRADGEWWTV